MTEANAPTRFDVVASEPGIVKQNNEIAIVVLSTKQLNPCIVDHAAFTSRAQLSTSFCWCEMWWRSWSDLVLLPLSTLSFVVSNSSTVFCRYRCIFSSHSVATIVRIIFISIKLVVPTKPKQTKPRHPPIMIHIFVCCPPRRSVSVTGKISNTNKRTKETNWNTKKTSNFRVLSLLIWVLYLCTSLYIVGDVWLNRGIARGRTTGINVIHVPNTMPTVVE